MMVSVNNEWVATQKVVKFGYTPFYCKCFAFGSGPVLFCRAESVGSNRYPLSLSFVSFLQEYDTTPDVTSDCGECERLIEIWK